MTKWSQFYNGRNCDSYRKYFEVKYRKFIDMIVDKASGYEIPFIHEVACGMGNTTRFIANNPMMNKSVLSASDNDPEMLIMAAQNLFNCGVDNIALMKEDAFSIGSNGESYDIIHSHGFIEHFTDDEILTLINAQLACCEHAIHYVPGDKYKEPSFGDERLLSVEKWMELNPTDIIEFNEGFDIILYWKKK